MNENERQVTEEIAANRNAEYDISPLILNRWSPRSFAPSSVSEHDLHSVLEAARWAPSASNQQPWRFVVAKTKLQLEIFYRFVNEGNLKWCRMAPVLLLAMSKTTNDKELPNRWHAFDAGTAWGFLALEAARRGLVTHAMGGFDAEMARNLLAIPDNITPHAVIALGYRGPEETLPDDLRLRERPSSRKTQEHLVIEGSFNAGNI